MTPRPVIFISAVSKELKSARQLVSNTLQFLGYEPVWQDIFGMEQGDLRAMLRQKIDVCKGVVQLAGKCYGAEPPAPDGQFGRVSYTQYEALYARQRGKKVWYLILDDNFPGDPHQAEPAELRDLQAAYRRRLQSESQLYHPLGSREALEAAVLKLRDDLTLLRRGVKQWAAAVMVLLVVLVGAVVWLNSGQRQESRQLALQNQQLTAMQQGMARLREAVTQYPGLETRIRQQQPGQNAAEVRQRTYDELAKQVGVDPKVLRDQLPQFAQKLSTAPDAPASARADAAFVAKDYSQAERLALAAAAEARKSSPPKTPDAIKALDLAGHSADARLDYAAALSHFRDAEQLTDRARDPLQWAAEQANIAGVLLEQGQFAGAEKAIRNAVEEYQRAHGQEDQAVLALRHNLAGALNDQGNPAEAEAEFRQVLQLREKVLGPENPDTLRSRAGLAATLLAQGKFAGAETEFRQVLQLREKVLGPENPDTLASHNDFAGALSAQGKSAEAEAAYRAVIKLEEKVLGPENPDTLVSRNNLAGALDDQGKDAEAEAEFQVVVQLQEKVLGPENPNTLQSRMGLADVLLRQAKYAGAESEFRTVIKLEDKVFGPEHHDTLRTCYNFALCLKAENKLDEAKVFARRAADGAAKVLGAQHPDTLKFQKLWQELQASNSPPP